MSKIDLYYPVNLRLSGKTCLVIGGGNEALRDIRSALESGAMVKVVSQKVVNEINTLNRMGIIVWKQKSFNSNDLKGTFLVFVSGQKAFSNKKISKECINRNVLVSITGHPEKSNFINPPTIRRGNLMFTVTTGDRSHALSTAIKKELETRYGREYARFLKLVGEVKGDIQDKFLSSGKQRDLLQKLMQPETMELPAKRNLKKFLEEVKKIMNV